MLFTVATTETEAVIRAARLFKAHKRRLRTGGQYGERNMGLLVAMDRACRVGGVRS